MVASFLQINHELARLFVIKMTPDYRQMGMNNAMGSNCSPDTIHAGLHTLYAAFWENVQMDKESQQAKIKLCQERIEEKEKEIAWLELGSSQKTTQIQNIQNKDYQIEINLILHNYESDRKNIEEKINDVKKNNPGPKTSNYLLTALLGVGVVVLVFYLWIYYVLAIVSALKGMQPGDYLMRTTAFDDISAESMGVRILYYLVPTIFLVLGVIIAITKNKKYIIGYLCLTFLIDAAIAYMIAHSTYYNSNNTEPWSPMMALGSIEFYLLIALGFVAYVIWGVALEYLVKGIDEIQENPIVKSQLDELEVQKQNLISKRDDSLKQVENSKITNQTDIIQLQNEILDNTLKINSLRNQIAHQQNIIQSINSGVKVASCIEIRGAISEFMTGWTNIATPFLGENATLAITTANNNSQVWLSQNTNCSGLTDDLLTNK